MAVQGGMGSPIGVRRLSSADLYNCYIFDLLTGDRLSFFSPEGIEESIETEWEEESPLFSVGNTVGFKRTGVRSPDVSFMLHEDYIEGYESDIRRAVNFIKSLAYPEYNTTLIAPAVFIKVCNISVYGYITGVSVSWRKPIRDDRYIIADVTLSIKERLDYRPTASDIRNGVV